MTLRQRERTTPRISVNKLGEYLVAGARRRKGIIIDQIRPKDFIVSRYSEAQASIVQFLSQGSRDKGIILNQIKRLASTPVSSVWVDEKNQNCINALYSFLEICDEIDLETKVVPVIRTTMEPN